MDERREAGRVRTFLRGRIVFNNRATSMDCLVRDLSQIGARLALSTADTLPDAFELTIAQKDLTHRCQLRWRRGDEVGVTFAEASHDLPAKAAQSQPSRELIARLRALEAENVELRRRLAALVPPVLESA